ncbi:coiled-coil domain-containing protein 18 isoform X1 [Drosophila eugracilis]|uniref:coiled-coil domain-containing protein 18 isoform X1 n=1 Tax=Drosophila eugracilis TaxID=29029 RepID=UPI0007E85DCB|nr:coiled-coil domain-containing protein 18 isoform X1 [Drosophila eugracilis]
MSSSTPGNSNALVKVATPSPSALAKIDVDFTGSKYEIHSSLSDEERRFYMKMYPTVDVVNQRKVHCTVCKLHLGTAPASENNIKMHPILRVTHCVKCHDFYNSGEFSKGEDGSELYCRWCGQGGEVYCCSTCPYVFCKSCIVKNLSRGVIVDIEQNEHWNCFSCTSKILWPLRAQHWALVNYIQTKKRALQSLQLPEVEARRQMLQDNSNCCRLAKSKASSLSDSMESLESNVSRRSQGSSVSSTKRGSVSKAAPSAPPTKRPKSSNDEVVCTPDLLSMLEPDCQLSVTPKPAGRQVAPPASITTTPRIVTVQQNYQPGPSSNKSSSNGPSASGSPSTPSPRSNLPPPLVLTGSGIRYRQNSPGGTSGVVRRTVVPNLVKSSGPVFHTINGFRVDLNSAAQQESYRLPNGRLIQVKRQMPQANQGSPPPQPPALAIPPASSGVVIRPRPPNPTNRPSLQLNSFGSNMGIYNPQTNQQQRAPHVRGVANANQGPPPLQGPPPNTNGGTLMITPAPPPQAKVPTLVRHNFPNTAMGQARAQLQEQIFSAMDICTHLTGKVVSLTHSNAYNQVHNYMDLKQLYIHMSYLTTYAIGRFKNLQEKCLSDMREKGFKNDANSLENGQLAAEKQASDDEDNEIEIVEPKTDTITIDSDNEDNTPSTSTSTPMQQPQQGAMMKITSVTSAAPKSEQMENQADIDVAAFSSTILASLLEVEVNEAANEPKSISPGQKKQPRKKMTNKPNPALLQLERQRMEDLKKSDAKLKKKVVVKLKRAEDEFEVARKWVEDCRKREQKLRNQEEDTEIAAEVYSNDTKKSAIVPSGAKMDLIQANSDNEEGESEKKVTDDKELVKTKETFGEVFKAPIKAKLGEMDNNIEEENLAKDEVEKEKELIKERNEKIGKQTLVSKLSKKILEIEKEKNAEKINAKVADKETDSTKENIEKEESTNKAEREENDDSKEVSENTVTESTGTEVVSDSENITEKEQFDTTEKELESEEVSEKEKANQKEVEEIVENEENNIVEENCLDATTIEIEEGVDKKLETQKSENKQEEQIEQLIENEEVTEDGDNTKAETEEIRDNVEEEKTPLENELTDHDSPNVVEPMDISNEVDKTAAAELDEHPKELLECALDEVIAMDGAELSAATEELMKALNSSSGPASENVIENETELDSNSLIETLQLETSEPPEILLKENESETSSKSDTPLASTSENGDPEIVSNQEDIERAVDSAQDEPITGQIVG